MTDGDPVLLDGRRGMAAQRATELRREIAGVRAEQDSLSRRQAQLELFLLKAPAESWEDAVEKARYLLGLFANAREGQDPRRQRIIAGLLADFDQLLAKDAGLKPD